MSFKKINKNSINLKLSSNNCFNKDKLKVLIKSNYFKEIKIKIK